MWPMVLLFFFALQYAFIFIFFLFIFITQFTISCWSVDCLKLPLSFYEKKTTTCITVQIWVTLCTWFSLSLSTQPWPSPRWVHTAGVRRWSYWTPCRRNRTAARRSRSWGGTPRRWVPLHPVITVSFCSAHHTEIY